MGPSTLRGTTKGDRPYPEGRALPVAETRLKIAKFDETRLLLPVDKGVRFHVHPGADYADLKTWFLDQNGGENRRGA